MTGSAPIERQQASPWVVAAIAAAVTAVVQGAYVLASILSWPSKGPSPVDSRLADIGIALGWVAIGVVAAYESRRAFKTGHPKREWAFATIALLSAAWIFWP
jgi:hypothetical protein